ncbi:AAA family ATPase [Agrobacterium rubi]|nr:AAA family ATPase [Agrobacterium rubi]NTF25161.1 AAA family ATPase [Agrobacterium rubi]
MMFMKWAKLGFLLPSRHRASDDHAASSDSFADNTTTPTESTIATPEPLKHELSEKEQDERDEHLFEVKKAFRSAFSREMAKACGIDIDARGRIYVLPGIFNRAIHWMPGEKWSGPNVSNLPGNPWDLSREFLLRSIHVDGFNDQYSDRLHAKAKVALRSLLEGGNSVVIGTPDAAGLPSFMKDFRYHHVEMPANLFPLAMRALLEAVWTAKAPGVLVTRSGSFTTIWEIIDDRGRVRGETGWISLKISPELLTMLMLEIEFQIEDGHIDFDSLLTTDFQHLVSDRGPFKPPAVVERHGENDEVSAAPTLDEMAGIRRVRKRVRRLIARSTSGQRKGILLHGPTGTGKTMLARTIAKETGRNLVVTSFAEWQSSGDGHLGTTLSAMRASFENARSKEPSILFIDEIDSLGSREGKDKNASYMRSVINSFLDQMDGFRNRGDVLVVGATNDLAALDPAILRHGRFGDQIEIPAPDMEDVAEIIEWYLAKAELPNGREPGLTGRAVSLRCFTESASTIRAVVEEAICLAREAEQPLSLGHFQAAMAVIDGDDEERPVTTERLRRTAIHEAGHAIAVRLLFGDRAKIGLATIRPAMGSLGHVVWEFEKGQEPQRVSDAAALIVVALAGRCAEIVEGGLGSLGYGAGSDLKQARRTAEHLVSLGMLPSRADSFVDKRDEEAVRKASGDWLSHLHGETMRMLQAHAGMLLDVADSLDKIQDLNGEDLTPIFARHVAAGFTHQIPCD